MKTQTLILGVLALLVAGIRLPPSAGQGSDLAYYMSVRAAQARPLCGTTVSHTALLSGQTFVLPF